MDRKKLFKTLSYLFILLFLVNFIAVKFYWYYTIWYFDMITHSLGGLCVGFGVAWLLSYRNPPFTPSFKLICQIILCVLLIGLLWEIYEFLVNNYLAQNTFNTLDTISDVCFDLFGGFCAILYILVPLENQRTSPKE